MPNLITTKHPIEVCYGSQTHCWWHDRDEPRAGAYRVCFECGHAFLLAADLLAEHNRQLSRYPELTLETDVSKVFCCPWCLHDW